VNNWALRFVVAVCLTLVASCLFNSASAHAEDGFSWTNSVLITNSSETSPYTGLDEQGRPDWGGGCIYREVYVGNLSAATSDVCIFDGDGFRYGILQEPIYFGSYVAYNKSFVIGFPNDARMYKVEGMPTQRILWTPRSKHIVYRTNSSNGLGNSLMVIRDIHNKLLRITNPDFSHGYRLSNNSSELLLKDELKDPISVGEVAASANGLWAVAQVLPKGIVRIDLRDFSKKWFSNYHPSADSEGELPEFAISNKGDYVAVVGFKVDARVILLNGGCGKPVTIFKYDWTLVEGPELTSPCSERQLQATVNNIAHNDLEAVRWPKFDRTGSKLSVYLATNGSLETAREYKNVSISASNYYDLYPSLDYLALGDSYSSGEGDIEKTVSGNTYYLSHTDVEGSLNYPQEKCHVSSRSYPFLLKRDMRVDITTMKSIACSGAVTYDLYINSSDYFGQGRRLANIPQSSMFTMQSEAIEDFIPGRIEQLNFVERYKPKVVTLTIGGNDVGFGTVIDNCARSLETCVYAKQNGLRGHQGFVISAQFESIKKIVNDIHRISPSTKVFLLGYPEFIYGGFAMCGLNVGFLDSAEREMIIQSIDYLNTVVEAAAKSTGATYIDIQDSLAGGRMCELGGYVTGIMDVKLSNASLSASFHPNAKGHVRIANTIKNFLGGHTLSSYPYIQGKNTRIRSPEPPVYFKAAIQALNGRTIQYDHSMTSSIMIKNQQAGIDVGSYSLKPDSKLSYTIYSDPISLGDFFANQEGGYTGNLVIPSDLPAGYHTLVLSGETYSGEPIDFYKNVLILGSNSSDVDEDGVSDSVDKCLFMPVSNVDADHDGIDDACDPEITNSVLSTELQLASVNTNENVDNIKPSGGTDANTYPKDISGFKLFQQNTIKSTMTDADNDNTLLLVLLSTLILGILVLLRIKYNRYPS
jgi:lysophospholipase L1-like esterase